MRLYQAELKRIIKLRSTLILLVIAVLISAFLAIEPITFMKIENEEGRDLKGKDAIRSMQEICSPSYGEITPDRLKEALKTYQELEKKYGGLEYGMPDPDVFPMDIYLEKLFPVEPLLRQIELRYTEIVNGARVPRPLEEIKLEEIDDFYEQGLLSLDQLAEIENVPEAQKKKVAEMYSGVTKPFYYSGFYDVQVLEYIMFYVLLIVLIGVLLSSTVFSKDYESGADQIFRCSKNGKMKLAIARIAAVTTVNIGMYCVTTTIHLAISYWAFGTSYFESSVWMYGGEPLVTMNILQMHIASILGGLLSLLAGSGMAYFISSKMEKSAPSIAIAFLLFLSPIVIYYAAGGNNWLTAILPTGGVGIHTSMYYTICDYRLLNIGSCCFWTPQVTMTFTLLWIPVFMILAGRSYCKHKIR